MYKISPEFDCQGQTSRSPGTKKALIAADTHRVRMKGMRSLQSASISRGLAHFMAARECFCQFYVGGKISAFCLVAYAAMAT